MDEQLTNKDKMAARVILTTAEPLEKKPG